MFLRFRNEISVIIGTPIMRNCVGALESQTKPRKSSPVPITNGGSTFRFNAAFLLNQKNTADPNARAPQRMKNAGNPRSDMGWFTPRDA